MRNDDVVFHGLDTEFLFRNFNTYWNAPMSTTIDLQSAVNFAGESGIILHLKNGNTDINKHYSVAQYEPNQSRYLDVNWISAHSTEMEWLFYGHSIFFEVINITHIKDSKQIPNNTLKQLNLLQKIIKQKEIAWESVTKRTDALINKVKQTREMIMSVMQHDDTKDEIDYLFDYLTNDNDDKFTETFINWYKFQEYDRDSLIYDIDNGYKIQSNLYQFLLANSKETYFDIMYELFQQQKQQRIKHQDSPYWLKLFQNFCLSQTEFISMRQPFQMPHNLQQELFGNNNCTTNLISF
eukprot:443237_1